MMESVKKYQIRDDIVLKMSTVLVPAPEKTISDLTDTVSPEIISLLMR